MRLAPRPFAKGIHAGAHRPHTAWSKPGTRAIAIIECGRAMVPFGRPAYGFGAQAGAAVLRQDGTFVALSNRRQKVRPILRNGPFARVTVTYRPRLLCGG